MTRWGASPAEVRATMPGDEIVGPARYTSTRAVTIAVPREAMWPWLVQLGQGRGGLYSYDWVENLLGLHMHSASRIVPAFQHLAVGDTVRLVPEDMEPPLAYVVARLEAPSTLVLGPDGDRASAFAARLPYSSWTSQLTPAGGHTCRLVVRFRADFAPGVLGSLMSSVALPPVHFVMERKMMLGIRQRAEGAVSRPPLTGVPG